MNDITIRTDTTELAVSVERILDELSLVEITNDADLNKAAELRKAAKTTMDMVSKTFEAERDYYYSTWKAVKEQENQFVKPLEKAVQTLNCKMSSYAVEKDRKAKEEAVRIRREIEAKAREAQLNEAIRTGDESIKDQEIAPIAVPVEKTKIKGTSLVQDWDVAVVDFAAVPDEYKMIDLAAVKKHVRATKGRVPVPGITITETRQVRQR